MFNRKKHIKEWVEKKVKENPKYHSDKYKLRIKKHIAFKEVKKHIDNLKSFKWCWNGIKKFNHKTDRINQIEVLK